MLIYDDIRLGDPSSTLLAVDPDGETERFYARMTGRLRLAAGVAGSQRADEAAKTLLLALTAAPADRPAFWRDFYWDVTWIVAACDARPLPPDPLGRRDRALAHLRSFLAENDDLARD